MSVPRGLLPTTVASSDLPLPTPVPSFAWSNVPATLDTCTSATIKWKYSGTPDFVQFILVPQVSARTNTALARKRNTGNTTIATRVQPTALAWTWPKVNASAGEYVLQASGTWVNVASSSFAITDGEDTSCLAVAVTSATATSTTRPHKPSNSANALPTTSVRSTGNAGVIAGGAVVGVVVAITALLAYWLWARRRKQQLLHLRNLTEATPHRDLPSQYVTSGNPSPAPLLSEKGADPFGHTPIDSPLSPNRRPPSFLFSDPYTPAPPYPSQIPARGQGGKPTTDVSAIRSCSSAALSDVTSTAGLKRTLSSCPPSYETRPSPPPSYTTEKTHSAPTPHSARSSYANPS